MAVIMVVSYNSMLNDVQSTVFDIINTDTTSITFANDETGTLASDVKVLDGNPKNLDSNLGTPYVLVQTPYINEKRITTTKFRMTMTVPIMIFSTREKNTRVVMDAVRAALKSGQSTTRAQHMYEYLGSSVELTREPNEDASKTVYIGMIKAEYKTVKT